MWTFSEEEKERTANNVYKTFGSQWFIKRL